MTTKNKEALKAFEKFLSTYKAINVSRHFREIFFDYLSMTTTGHPMHFPEFIAEFNDFLNVLDHAIDPAVEAEF